MIFCLDFYLRGNTNLKTYGIVAVVANLNGYSGFVLEQQT